MGRFEEALAQYDRVLPIASDKPDILNRRGAILTHLCRFDEALASYDRALALDPDFAEAWNNRGGVLRRLQRWDEAVECFSRALALRPDFAQALINRSSVLGSELQRFRPAIRDLEHAILLVPNWDYLHGELLHLRMQIADWDQFDRDVALIRTAVRARARIVQPYVYQAVSDAPCDLQLCARIFADDSYPAASPLWRKTRSPRTKIRIGYLSGEFRLQATALLAAGLYELHDRDRFEIVAFDNGWDDGSDLRARLEKAFDRIIDISAMTDAAAAQRIAAEEIDILVNLNGYFGLPRMGVFAHRPAPLQVSYLGFPGTLGVDYIDYLVADRIVIPPDAYGFYTENIVTLPDCYQVNDFRRPPPGPPPTRADCALPEKGFVFCNFNYNYKLTPHMFALWMRLLARTEGSVLWLLENNPDFAANLRRAARHHGIAGERLIFAEAQPPEQHISRLGLADLALDSLPCNMHTTGSDMLWAGVPLLTCLGKAFPGRVGASLLHAIGLPELVCDDIDAYEALALKLARDPALLSSIRMKLAANRTRAPLFDTDRSRRHLEAAYTIMWEKFRSGAAPCAFQVARCD